MFTEDEKIGVAAPQVRLFAVRTVNGAVDEMVRGLWGLVHFRQLLRVKLPDRLTLFGRSYKVRTDKAVAVIRMR
jgi:hypothetical protein